MNNESGIFKPHDANPENTKIAPNFTDICLEDMRAVFNAITLNTIEPIILGDHRGCISFVNAAAEHMLGKNSDDLLGEDIASLFEVYSLDLLNEGLFRVLNEREVSVDCEAFCCHVSGRSVPVFFSLSPVLGGRNSESLMLTFKDLTAIRRAARSEELLQKQADHEKAQYETILKQIPVGVLVAEASGGRIIFRNDVAKGLFPLEALDATALKADPKAPAENLGEDFPNGPHKTLARAIFQGETTQGEVIKVHHSSGYRYLAVNAAPIRNSAGEITSGVLAAYDISQERETQNDLLKARIDAERAAVAKSSFLANISHEIRTPLGAIVGFTGLLRSGDIAPQEIDSILDIIERNGQDLVRLIDEILDLSKVEAQKIEVEQISCSLSKVLDNVKDLLGMKASEKGISLTFERQGELPDHITTDPLRLKQILVNIIGNAIKFTERGSVRVMVSMPGSMVEDPAILEIAVKDSGIGISNEQAHKLFLPFSQVDYQINRKYGGTGLGLAMSKSLAQLLSGDVQLRDSQVDEGSVFVITTNVAPCGKSGLDQRKIENASTALPPTLNRRLSGMRVLAADDSTDNQLLIKRILEKEGAYVELANDGLEAVAKAQNQNYDVVLMDIQMPNLDGYEATRQLRLRQYKKTIIALSAHALQTERNKSLLAGCDDHITKPIQPHQLVNRIFEFCNSRAESN